MKASEHDRGGDDEIAFGGTIFSRDGALGLAHQLKYPLAIRYVGAPRVSQSLRRRLDRFTSPVFR